MNTYFDNKISFYSNFNTYNIELSINEIENMTNNIDNLDNNPDNQENNQDSMENMANNIDNQENMVNIDNIKYVLTKKLNELGIVCSSRNIKLFDVQNNYEIKTTKDLLTKNTKQCKIIIVPVECNCRM